jgi:hypothetical protein
LRNTSGVDRPSCGFFIPQQTKIDDRIRRLINIFNITLERYYSSKNLTLRFFH